ncbi:MAG: hypothetical protein K0S96_568 [Geminicoccaceae bacterium]|nr:hypothetical protein [Geminicoccaceae bacterium]
MIGVPPVLGLRSSFTRPSVGQVRPSPKCRLFAALDDVREKERAAVAQRHGREPALLLGSTPRSTS